MMRNLWVGLLLAGVVCACNSEKETCAFIPPATDQPVTLNWTRLESELAGISTRQQLRDFLQHQPVVREVMFRRSEYPDDSAFLDQLYSRITNPHFDTLVAETQKVFGAGEQLRQEFEGAFNNLKYYYPDFVPPRIATVVTGMDTDLFISDTLIVIGLDYYLGSDAKYRPMHLHQYLLRKYDPEDIVPTVMLLYGINDRYNKSDPADQTVLADMVAYGKAYRFAKAMLPCVPDSVLISYTKEEIQGSEEHQDLIWARFLESQVLFSTSQMVKRSYLSDRPFTLEVGEKCPGRIGQWVGWQIVNQYASSHAELSLPELMKLRNANEIFQQSGYKPIP